MDNPRFEINFISDGAHMKVWADDMEAAVACAAKLYNAGSYGAFVFDRETMRSWFASISKWVGGAA